MISIWLQAKPKVKTLVVGNVSVTVKNPILTPPMQYPKWAFVVH